MTSLGSALYIEPYGGGDDGDEEEDGRLGVAIVTKDYTEFLSYDQWNEKGRFSEDEIKILEKSIESSGYWARPSSRLPERYASYLREFDDYPEGLDEAEITEYARERMKRILGDIGRRIVASLPKNISLKHDEDYEILAVAAVSSFFRNQFPFSPLICVYGAPNCGKSTVLECMARLMYHGRFSHGYTGASLYLSVDKYNVSPCIDEIVLNLGKDKDQAVRIMEFLLGTCYKGRKIDRMDHDSKELSTYDVYTSCIISVKGGIMPDDLRSRSLMIEMPLTKRGQRTRSVALSKFTDYAPGTNPREILDDLYALMLITKQSAGTAFGKEELRGIWFEHFQRETLRILETEISEGSGIYLYSTIYGIESEEINNRDEDTALMFLTIGECMGFGYDIIRKISENARNSLRQRAETTPGRMFEAFARLIRKDFEEQGLVGTQSTITKMDIVQIVRKIKISDVSNEYRRIKNDEGTGGDWSDKSLYNAFSDLTFVHTKRGMHNALRVDSDDPGFPELFARSLEIYADDDTREFYTGFLREMHRGLA